jgi:hypothetical protein
MTSINSTATASCSVCSGLTSSLLEGMMAKRKLFSFYSMVQEIWSDPVCKKEIVSNVGAFV